MVRCSASWNSWLVAKLKTAFLTDSSSAAATAYSTMVANFTFAWSWVMAWNSSCKARFCSDSRYEIRSQGIFRLRPSRMMR